MPTEQIRFKKLLQDPVYLKWFNRKPSPPSPSAFNPPKPPWAVYVQREQGGRWQRALFHTYPSAHKYVRSTYKSVWDLTLGCLKRDYGPPLVVVSQNGHKRNALWRGMPEGHRWCGYCRRPTVFRYFSHHHAIPGPVADYELRCSICGARAVFIVDWYHR